ncbi:MAG: tetratricopeptide repeat protein [Gammaproteobacteria bacterium]|nr:tetratricopeptide repeat protein [Gammaproteobacteria bacterium]
MTWTKAVPTMWLMILNPSEVLALLRRLLTAGLALTLFILVAPNEAGATNLAQANAAARSGDYATALEHYEAVRASDGDSALLAFNRGVAQFRLGLYPQAEASFAKASQSLRFAPRSFYNLGLVMRARGRSEDAQVWFRQAALHPSASKKLELLARRAERSLDVRHIAARRVPVEFGRDPERAIDFFDFGLVTRMALDSNVYRSPSSGYVDLAAAGTPSVDPEGQSANYAPIAAWASATWGRWAYSRFTLGYRFDGDIYLDSEFSKANRYAQILELGNTYDETPVSVVSTLPATFARHDSMSRHSIVTMALHRRCSEMMFRTGSTMFTSDHAFVSATTLATFATV